MKTKHIIITFILSFAASMQLFAQNTSTLYFMEEIPERNSMNPAFIPNTKFYLDFLLLPNTYTEINFDKFTLNDFIYNQNGTTAAMWNSPENANKFVNGLKRTTTISNDFRLNILSLGFRFKEKNYLTIGYDIRITSATYLPKDLFKFIFQGTPDSTGTNSFNLNSFGLDATLYSELAIGYMRQINPKWTIGGKAKLLMGYANIYTDINQFRLDASRTNWTMHTNATLRGSIPVTFGHKQDGTADISQINPLQTSDYIRLLYQPSGIGAAFDLGATYKPIKNLTLSAAITDLGFIHWKKYNVQATLNGDYSFNGFFDYNIGSNDSTATAKLKQLGNDLADAADFTDQGSAYNTMIMATANIGAEYGILNNKISFGALSRTKFNNTRLWEEITISTNFRPANFFKTSLSYSLTNGNMGTIGWGINTRVGMFNTYLILDYIPFSFAKLSYTDNQGETKTIPAPIPNKIQRLNLETGLILNIGRYSSDLDNDGVKNRKDKCPNTDIDFLMTQCPNSKKKDIVDKQGCIRDQDHDGIADCYDQCPNTPANVQVDTVGCPIDTDKDSVPDYLDKCPNTPQGIPVDTNGCPYDTDKDGVPNYLDKCPNTPRNVLVDSTGCPIDTDKDSVPDYLDKCPNTPQGIPVDTNGCPYDTDKDGVPDYLDKCPNTPRNTPVDSIGCPLDTDGDGIPDKKDKCPNKFGPASNQGCPELKKEVKNLFKKAMHGIQFQTGKATIKKISYPILDQIVAVMNLNNDYMLTINGYTDNVGNDQYNLTLSQERADAVKQYLINKGINANRLTAKGYGEADPVATNNTSSGRALNRRVEFFVNYETITYEKIENPELKNDSTGSK